MCNCALLDQYNLNAYLRTLGRTNRTFEFSSQKKTLLLHERLCKIFAKLQKVLCLTVLERLAATGHSPARSHYWLTRGLLAAGFPPWPSPPLIRQPDPAQLPGWVHVDASLSADAGSTWTSDHQESPPQAILQNLPPGSWITRARHDSRQCLLGKISGQLTRDTRGTRLYFLHVNTPPKSQMNKWCLHKNTL